MVLDCHVISQNHIIKGPCDFMGGTSAWYFPPLPSFVVIDTW